MGELLENTPRADAYSVQIICSLFQTIKLTKPQHKSPTTYKKTQNNCCKQFRHNIHVCVRPRPLHTLYYLIFYFYLLFTVKLCKRRFYTGGIMHYINTITSNGIELITYKAHQFPALRNQKFIQLCLYNMYTHTHTCTHARARTHTRMHAHGRLCKPITN